MRNSGTGIQVDHGWAEELQRSGAGRTEASQITYGIPGWDDTQKRVLTATVEGVRIVDVYVPNGQSVGSEQFIQAGLA